MPDGFRIHIITPRHLPDRAGLDDLYDGIMATTPERGQSRHMMDEELHLIHRQWYKGLVMLQRMGCIEWMVSRLSSDLSAGRRTRFPRRESNES